MMKRLAAILQAIFLLLLILPGTAFAQDKKLVQGRITNKLDNNKPVTDIVVYAYNTEAEGEDAYNEFQRVVREGGYYSSGLSISTCPDQGGNYEIRVPEGGSLLFLMEVQQKAVLEKVRGRLEINVKIEVGITLDESVIAAEGAKLPIISAPEAYGGTVSCGYAYPIEIYHNMTDTRFGMQAFLIGKDASDTVMCRAPYICDGNAYHLTQLRRMGYSAGNDPLYRFADKNPALNDSMDYVQITDTLELPDPDGQYVCTSFVWFEDYTHIYKTDSVKVFDTKRMRRPMQFLDYYLEEYELDAQKYRRKPRRVRADVAGNMSLNFLIGKTAIDPRDTASKGSLIRLRQDLDNIIHGDGTTLKEFHIVGTASPDGSYARNLDLAKRRMDYANNLITGNIPSEVRRRIWITSKAVVAPWSDVEKLLRKDGYTKEADELESIISKYRGNHDFQGYAIRRLPYYKSLIYNYLPQLRSVRYSYKSEQYKELSAEEILAKYQGDPAYRKGKKEIEMYEYWSLFNTVKDTAELRHLYKMAYDYSARTEATPWIYAANKLAIDCIRRGKPDTTILAPVLNFKNARCNIPRMKMDGTPNLDDPLINPAEVVANQAVMHILLKQYIRAMQISSILPDKYRLLKYTAYCLAGYFRGSSDYDRQVFTTVRDSSPRNRVVMNLAVGNLSLARKALEEQDMSDPVNKYLKVEIICRSYPSYPLMSQDSQDEAAMLLADCFNADKKYFKLAEGDWDVFEEIVKMARSYYEHPDWRPDYDIYSDPSMTW